MMTYPKVVLSKSPPPAGERTWAYALGAVYNVGHGLPVDTIALDADPAEAAAETKQMIGMLDRDWGITDRVTLVERLDGLSDGGHRRRFLPQLRFYATMWRPEVAARREELRAVIRDGGEGADGAVETLWRLDAVQADLPGLRASPLLAFDAARAAMLFRCGLMLGWLGEADWDYLVDAARDVRRSYGSLEGIRGGLSAVSLRLVRQRHQGRVRRGGGHAVAGAAESLGTPTLGRASVAGAASGPAAAIRSATVVVGKRLRCRSWQVRGQNVTVG